MQQSLLAGGRRPPPCLFRRLLRPGALAFVATVVLAGCAGGDGSKSDPASDRPTRERAVGGGSLFDQIEAKRRQQKDRAERAVDLEAGARELPAGWKEQIDGAWAAWRRTDRSWPEQRAKWIALGPLATGILVENLIRAYVLAYDSGDGQTYYRARAELADFKSEAVPYLVEGLAGGLGDDVVRNLCGELLAYLGDSSVPQIEQAYAAAGEDGRRALARALKKMQNPASLPLLIRIAGGDDPFTVRIEAIETVGRIGSKDGVPVLRKCLADQDISVRKFAATWLGALGDNSAPVLEDIAACMHRAAQNAEAEVVRACRASLKRLAGRDFGNDAAVWRDWIRTSAPRAPTGPSPAESRKGS